MLRRFAGVFNRGFTTRAPTSPRCECGSITSEEIHDTPGTHQKSLAYNTLSSGIPFTVQLSDDQPTPLSPY
jgi:predicted secreted protein